MRALVLADNTYGWEHLPTSAPADIILTLGDLYGADIDEVAAHYSLPVLGVYGNHCTPDYLDEKHTNLAGPGRAQLGVLSGLTILGVDGCIRYKKDPYVRMYTQEQYAAVLDQITTPIDVVVTHCPPRGCNDSDAPDDPAHHGIAALTRLVERCHPTLILHGHTYPDPPIETFRGARVAYVSGWAVVDLPAPRTL